MILVSFAPSRRGSPLPIPGTGGQGPSRSGVIGRAVQRLSERGGFTLLAPFLSLPAVAADVEALDPLETTFRERLAAKKAAADLVARLEAEEKASRLTTREQLQSAYGRLRDVYKSNPKLAERYFERSRRKPAKKPASTDTGPV